MSQPTGKEKQVFDTALGLGSAAEREAYLAQACAGDGQLLEDVEALLRTHGGMQDSHDPSSTGSRSSSRAPTSGGAPSGLSETIDIPLSITEKPSDRIGRYKLLEEIGKGGFGSVWMAEQEEPIRRRVALKIIKLGMDTREVVARFQAERQALAMMDHPNIASVYDGGATDTGRPYFVMELVRGVPITEYCDANMLTTRERLELFTQVCNAVQHAHQKGIIHRDLKPSNILVTERDDQAVVKVIDFGVAKATQARLTEKTLFTQFRQFIGTPVYMSPEQTGLGGLDIDTRSDIYALGVLLYELLTGQTPFDTQKMMQGGYDTILRTIREGEPPKPSTRLTTLSAQELSTVAAKRRAEPAKLGRLVRGDLDWIVMKALEKDRQRRYQTAIAFAQDLQHYLRNEPVEAVAPSVRYQVVKFMRRHQVGVSFAAAMAFLAALGFAGVVWQWRRAQATAVAEARAKAEATQLSALAVDRLSQMQIQRAHEMLGSNQVHQALASLARVLRQMPTNRAAAELTLSVLSHRNFALPVSQPVSMPAGIRAMQFGPDGRLRGLTFTNTTVRVWDVLTDKTIVELHHAAQVDFGNLSADGQQVITLCTNDTAWVWEVGSGQPLSQTLKPGGKLKSAWLSVDGQQVAIVTEDKTVHVLEVRTGQAVIPPLRHEREVFGVQFSADGARILTPTEDGARIWDASTGKPLIKVPPDEDKDNEAKRVYRVYSAEFSPDGQRVVTAFLRFARVWDAGSGAPLTELLEHDSPLSSARFSPDGHRVVTASHDRTAHLWDGYTGRPLSPPLRHRDPVGTAKFSPDGQQVATYAANAREGSVQIWNVNAGQSLAPPLKPEGKVVKCWFSRDGRRLAVELEVLENQTTRHAVQVWDTQTIRPVMNPFRTDGEIHGIHFSASGEIHVLTIWNNTARVWDVITSQPVTGPLQHEGVTESAIFSPDGQRVMACSGMSGFPAAQIWDVATETPLPKPLKHEQGKGVARFSPDGQQVVTVWKDGTDGTAQIWDARTGQPLTKPLKDESDSHSEDINYYSADFTPDGRRVVTVAGSKIALIWDARTGKSVTEPLKHEANVQAARFSPDGRRVATWSEDKTVRLWDAGTGQLLTDPIKHEDTVASVAFSPDGERVATVSYSNSFWTVRLWDARTGLLLTEPIGLACGKEVQFSPDGRWLAVPLGEKGLLLHEVPTVSLPVPPWLPELAEAVAGQRLDARGISASVSVAEMAKLQRQLLSSVAPDDYTHWAKWFLGDRRTRTISAFSSLTVPKYIQRRIQEDTLESLQEIVRLSPTNALALARLAKKVLAQDPKDNPRRLGEADFYSRRAIQWSPKDAEVARIRTEIAEQIKAQKKE